MSKSIDKDNLNRKSPTMRRYWYNNIILFVGYRYSLIKFPFFSLRQAQGKPECAQGTSSLSTLEGKYSILLI